MTTPTLPATAWEQAVFVSLFVIFTISVLIILRNVLKDNAKNMAEIAKQFQDSLKEQRQEFSQALRAERADFEDRNDKICQTLDSVKAAIDANTEKVTGLDAKFDQAMVDMRSARAKRKASDERPTAPRTG